METSEHKKALNRERSRRWRLAHPERKKEQAKRWEEKNKTYQEDYYLKNSERIKERVAKYNSEKPHIKRESDRRRRARKYETRTEMYTEQQVLDKWGSDCFICQEPIDLTVSGRPGYEGWEKGLHMDHYIPFIAGGTDTLDNVRPTHGICNLKKKAKILEEKDGN